MPRRKALKVIVDIHLHAITCPGVFLPEQNDVFVYVELLGQRKRTQSMPPVFPFLFHEKIRFDKVFSHCTDPVQIASALSGESVRIELVQLTYPAGELLATYEDNAREFLFPTPRASPSYPGVDREVLLRRSSTFTGIAPKLEFSSRTVIKEVTSTAGTSHSARRKKEKCRYECDLPCQQLDNPAIVSSTPHQVKNHVNNRSSSVKKKTNQSSAARNGRVKARSSSLHRASTQWGYEQSTVASRARSPSPYTKRRMAQLSIKDPFDSAVKNKPFKTELEERPEFVMRKATRDCLSFNKSPPCLPCLSPGSERRKSPSRRSTSPSRRKQTPAGPSRYCHTGDFGSDDTAELIDSAKIRPRRSGSGSRPTSARSAPESTPRPITPRRDLSFSRADLDPECTGTKSRVDPDSILFRRPLRERFNTGEPSPYEKIRDRVRDLLSSPRANRILEDSMTEANDRYWKRRSHSPSPRVSPRCAVSVPLGNGDYWSERGSDLLGKSHRCCFEENMDKIYDGIYSNLRKQDS